MSNFVRIVIGVTVAIILALLGWFLFGTQDEPTPVVQAPQGTESSSATATTPIEQPATETAPAEQPTAEPAPEAADTASAEPDATTSIEPPSFDLVRVDALGMATIAGRGLPGALIEILLDDQVLAEGTVDASGAFAVIGMVPPGDKTQVLSLRMSTSDNLVVASSQTVGVSPVDAAPADAQVAALAPAVPEAPDAGSATQTPATDAGVALSAPSASTQVGQTDTTDVADQAASDATTRPETGSELAAVESPADADGTVALETTSNDSTNAADAPVLENPELQTDAVEPASDIAQSEQPEPAALAAPQVVLADETGVSVLQSGGAEPLALTEIALDSISYDEAGDVTLAGRSTGAGSVQVYLNNQPVQNLPIDDQGRWRAPLPEIDTGVYTLRIDEIDAEGQVVSRIETPFKREDPAVLAAAIAAESDGDQPVKVVTVQKGNTLWGISRERYGRGMMYVHVFQANQGLIRDPNLIYPGQVFTFPELNQDQLEQKF